jgi:thymidine kinase
MEPERLSRPGRFIVDAQRHRLFPRPPFGQTCRHRNGPDAAGVAKLYFSYAAMNAGKSTMLLQASYNYLEQGMQTLLYTSALYAEMDRNSITSRIGVTAPANLYEPQDDLYAQIARRLETEVLHCVFVDEAQFLTREQVWQLARVADRLHVPVMCYGLRTDFQGKLFPGSSELLAIADVLREVRTICECGAKATMVVRMDENGNALTEGHQVAIGKDVYVSFCRRHWEERTGRWPSRAEAAE